MDQQPERGRFTHDARDRFTQDQIGKGHIGVESIDPDTQEKTRTLIHDPPTDTIAAQDHQNKHTGHELRAAKESGNHSSDSQGGGHHVERVVTNTGSYMMEKDTGESGTQGTDKMQQQSGDMEQQQSGNQGQGSEMSGEELRGRIDQMMEESEGHFSRGTWVGNKQEQHLVHHLKNAHELGHGHHGPGEGNIPKHMHQGQGPILGHTTKAEQHLGKSEKDAKLALDMADAERSHRTEHQHKQMEHRLEQEEQRMKQQQDIANSHIIDTTNFGKGQTM